MIQPDDNAPALATLEEVAQFVDGRPIAGVSVPRDARPEVVAFLAGRLNTPGRTFLLIPADLPTENLSAWFVERLPKPSSAVPPQRTASDWKDALLTALRDQQQLAQERVNAARSAGQPPDAFDRDVAGWLANGLVDLLGDKITGESFLQPGGVFQRLAEKGADAAFAENDFQRPNDIRFMEASRPAQSMLTKLSLASTNQFRASAARLMNQLVGGLMTAPASAAPGGEIVLLLEDPALKDWLPAGVALSRIVAVGDAEQFEGWPAVCRFALPVPVVEEVVPTIPEPELVVAEPEPAVAEEAPVREPEPAVAEVPVVEEPTVPGPSLAEVAWQAELARQELFLANGILTERVDGDIHEFEQWEVLRQRLERAWGEWFAKRLAEYDTDELLFIEEITQFAAVAQEVRQVWSRGEEARLPLPETARDICRAEGVFDRLKELRDRNRIINEYEEMAIWSFDRHVARGTATLDMLDSDVLDFLHERGRDLSKYRIVKIDE